MRCCKIIAMFALALFAVACSKGDGVVMPEFSEYIFATDDTKCCEVSIKYQRIANADASAALASIDEQNYQNTFGNYSLDVMDVEVSASTMAADYQSMCDDCDVAYYYYLDQRAFMTRDDKVVCYETYIESYTGGAHGGNIMLYECFDLASGAIYDFDYLFEDVWGEAMRKLVYDKLVATYGVLLIEGVEELPMSTSLLITDTGILFVYQPYEVACFAAGILSVEVSDEEMVEVGAPILW